MYEVQNMDEPYRNLLNIWVFDTGKNLLGFGEKGKKNTIPRLKVAACRTLWSLAFIACYNRTQ